jgi:hypothetical protein
VTGVHCVNYHTSDQRVKSTNEEVKMLKRADQGLPTPIAFVSASDATSVPILVAVSRAHLPAALRYSGALGPLLFFAASAALVIGPQDAIQAFSNEGEWLGTSGWTRRDSVTPSVMGRFARRWRLRGEPQEPGEPALARAGGLLLPSPIPCASGPGGVHRWSPLVWGMTPADTRAPIGTGSNRGVALT